MGRAQVFQAEACNIEPLSYMNPILLKPCGNHISQVIVNGKFIANMNFEEYASYKFELLVLLKDTFNKTEKDCDVVVLEGAGSPVELNINSLDISNMEMAKLTDSNVILVADIDKGGFLPL